MLPDRVSNPGPLTYESGALPIALRGPALVCAYCVCSSHIFADSWRYVCSADDKIFICKFSKKFKSKLYHIENSKTRGQTVEILMRWLIMIRQ